VRLRAGWRLARRRRLGRPRVRCAYCGPGWPKGRETPSP
jgi:hypothetical protein